MIKFNYSLRTFIKPNGQVAIRVRWNERSYEVTFITGVYAETKKWVEDLQKAAKNTTHHVRDMSFTASEINRRIAEFTQEIQSTFDSYSLGNSVPTPAELKFDVNNALGRISDSENIQMARVPHRSFRQLFDDFLIDCGRERNWDEQCKQKYIQAFEHITSAVPSVEPETFTMNTMYTLREWYVKNGYKNRTAVKQARMLKCFLKWIDRQEGYSIPKQVLEFTMNLKVMKRTVTFLHYDELQKFLSYQFQANERRLEHARDLWCFMALTSLRYSDLCNLKTGHICGKRIDMMTQKTNDHIVIPLTDDALAILKKYQGQESPEGHIFKVPSNQKLNDAIKDAARRAGLNRVVIDSYLIGNERREEQRMFCDIISCHDARRTFVSCSLAMGIPPQVVMKCTGHKCYNTMKPYIDTTSETQALEMEKWNQNKLRSRIVKLLEYANENQLREILDFVSLVNC